MEVLATNQKNLMTLQCEKSDYDKIFSSDKFIIFFGSNGQGKTTLASLLKNENCEKNFEHDGEDQQNRLYKIYENNKKYAFDDNYINNIVYENDGISSNNLKVILKTKEIDELLNIKTKTNERVYKIRKLLYELLDYLTRLQKNIKFKSAKPTATQTIFLKPIIDVKDFESSDNLSKKDVPWWIKGLNMYNDKEKKCPWCEASRNNFSNLIGNILDSKYECSDEMDKIIKSYTDKENFLSTLTKDEKISKHTLDTVEKILTDMSKSQVVDKSNDLKEQMITLAKDIENDVEIINSLLLQVQLIDNITELKEIAINNNLKELRFLKKTDELKDLDKEINDFANNINSVVKSINESNKKLVDVINNSQDEINKVLEKLGMNYEFEIQQNNIIGSDSINNSNKYVTIKSKTESHKDLTEKLGNVLSYGEHSTLAFAIFIAEIRNLSDIELQNSVLLLDDPISSYDMYRRYISISLLNDIIGKVKKTFIFTHELSFVLSLNWGIDAKKLIYSINTTDGVGIIKKEELNELQLSEIRYYRDEMISNGTLVHKALAYRKLIDLYQMINNNSHFSAIYSYLCIILHYRKNEDVNNPLEVKNQLIKLQEIYSINDDFDNDKLLDKDFMLKEIDNYFNDLKKHSYLNLKLEDLLSFRILAEKAIRDECYKNDYIDAYSEKEKNMWELKNSSIVKKLCYYRPYLNSLCHLDGEQCLEVAFTKNDFKYMPNYVKECIFNIIFCK